MSDKELALSAQNAIEALAAMPEVKVRHGAIVILIDETGAYQIRNIGAANVSTVCGVLFRSACQFDTIRRSL
jgi:hypothetical protein